MDSHWANHLSPASSISNGARIYLGDHVLVRIPVPIDLEPNTNVSTNIGSASNLPPISAGRSPEHFAFVCSTSIRPDNSIELEVYPQLSFSRSGGAVAGYNNLATDAMRASLIPLPPLSSGHPTPESFGAPLTVGGWLNDRDTWLSVNPIKFIIPFTRPFKKMNPPVALSDPELVQLVRYRTILLTTTIGGDAEQGTSGDRSGEKGRKGGSGFGQGSRFGSHFAGRNWGTVKGFGKKKGGGAGRQEEFKTSLPSNDLPVLEGVNEDEQVTYPTYKDDVLLMASYSDNTGMWKEELAKILREEREEQETLKTERMTRLDNWLQTLSTT